MRNTDPTFGDLGELRAKMLTWARRLTRGGNHAEDLVQSAILSMLANRHRAPAGQIDPWAQVVLRNVFLMQLRVDRRSPGFTDLDHVTLAAVENPETQTYCRQVLRRCLGLDPSLLLDPESNGQRWDGGVAKTATERRRRYRARLALQPMVAA